MRKATTRTGFGDGDRFCWSRADSLAHNSASKEVVKREGARLLSAASGAHVAGDRVRGGRDSVGRADGFH
jgi:hypothetical protein